jgi:hypothetical protein
MRPSSATISAAILSTLLLMPVAVRAQQAALNTEVQITKIETGFLTSPKITVPGFTKQMIGRPAPWMEVEVTFERTAKDPKFADELTFNYYVLLKNERFTEDKKPTMLTASIIHVNVPQEKGLHSVVYVSPKALASLFDGKTPVNAQQTVTDVGVTISGKSGLLALKSLNAPIKGDKGWWDNTALYTPKSGVLLNKNETPFAPLEWDYYEAVKSKSGN